MFYYPDTSHTAILNWLKTNTKLQHPKISKLEELLRLLISYATSWHPPDWKAKGHSGDIPLPELIMKIWIGLIPFQEGMIVGTTVEENPLQLFSFPWIKGDESKPLKKPHTQVPCTFTGHY